jgi:hypothetical protein
MPLFQLWIYIKVCVSPQIFSKSIDIWIWNCVHLLTTNSQFCTQKALTLSSILTELCHLFDLEFTLKFVYHLKLHRHFALRACILFHHHNLNLCTGCGQYIKLFTILCPIFYNQALRKVEDAVTVWTHLRMFLNLKFHHNHD